MDKGGVAKAADVEVEVDVAVVLHRSCASGGAFEAFDAPPGPTALGGTRFFLQVRVSATATSNFSNGGAPGLVVSDRARVRCGNEPEGIQGPRGGEGGRGSSVRRDN